MIFVASHLRARKVIME